VLAGGIIVDERARGSLDIVVSKPLRAADYFTVKLTASAGAFTTFYVAGVIGAAITFPWRVPGFDVGDLLALSATHLFAALFGVIFSATMAVVFERKLIGMLVSFTVLELRARCPRSCIGAAQHSVRHLKPSWRSTKTGS
jgi:ABC-2 type transport system permease protein